MCLCHRTWRNLAAPQLEASSLLACIYVLTGTLHATQREK